MEEGVTDSQSLSTECRDLKEETSTNKQSFKTVK